MQQIFKSRKFQDGIEVFWVDAEKQKSEFFTFEELVGMRINALDLLNNPHRYLVNAAAHALEPAASGCGFPAKTCEDGILITRLFDAPRDLAWTVWTQPSFVVQWWGPKDFTSPSATNDLRDGGKYLYCMRSADGRDYWSTGVYLEVRRPEKIVCTDSFADEKGNVVPASYYGMEGIPSELILTVTFEVQAGRTLLTLHHNGFPAGEQQDLARAGWNQSLDKYAGILAKTAFGKAGGGGPMPQGTR